MLYAQKYHVEIILARSTLKNNSSILGIEFNLQNKKSPYLKVIFYLRRHPDLNWGIEVLQTFALPLGHGAILYSMHKTF